MHMYLCPHILLQFKTRVASQKTFGLWGRFFEPTQEIHKKDRKKCSSFCHKRPYTYFVKTNKEKIERKKILEQMQQNGLLAAQSLSHILLHQEFFVRILQPKKLAKNMRKNIEFR